MEDQTASTQTPATAAADPVATGIQACAIVKTCAELLHYHGMHDIAYTLDVAVSKLDIAIR